MRYPALAAIAFTSVMVGSIWWQTRDEGAEPVAATGLSATTKSATGRKAAAAKLPKPLTENVRVFVAFAKEKIPAESPRARAATAQGMRLLAGAIAARGDSTLWSDRAKRLEEAASRVADASDSTVASQAAHEALGQAAQWVAALPRVKFEREALASAAEAVAPGQPLRDQAAEVTAFFSAAARALEGAQA